MSRFTDLLEAAGGGDGQAAADLFSLVYNDLRQLAGRIVLGVNGKRSREGRAGG
jgi:hypothetical protein